MKNVFAALLVSSICSASFGASVTCKVIDNNSQQVIADFRRELVPGTKSLEKTEVSSNSGIKFVATLNNGEMTVGYEVKSGFSVMNASISKNKKAQIKNDINGLNFTFACEYNKKS